MQFICSSSAREYAASLARIDDDTMFWTLKKREGKCSKIERKKGCV